LLPSPEAAAPFIVAAALFSIGLVPVVLTRVEQPKPISKVELKLKRLWSISPLSVAGTFVVAMINGSLIALGPVFAQRIGFNTAEVAMFMSLIFAGGVVLQWPIGHVSDTWDRRTVILLVCLGGAAAALAAWGFVDRSLLGMLIAMFFLGGAAFSLYPLCVANANDHTEADDFVATASGLLLVYGIGAAIGPLAAGSLLQGFGTSSMPLYFATLLIALALFVAGRKAVSPPPPADLHERFVMLGRTSQSALTMLAGDTGRADPAGEATPTQPE
jgi:MFS family permease